MERIIKFIINKIFIGKIFLPKETIKIFKFLVAKNIKFKIKKPTVLINNYVLVKNNYALNKLLA